MKGTKYKLCILLFLSLLLFLNLCNANSNNNHVSAQTKAVIAILPSEITLNNIGDTFKVDIKVSNVQHACYWGVNVTWDNTKLALVGDPIEGDFLSSIDTTMFLSSAPYTNQPALGIWSFMNTLMNWPATGVSASGSGVLASMTFRILKSTVETPISLVGAYLSEPIEAQSPTGMKLIDHETQTPALVTLVTGTAPIANAGQPQTVNEDTLMVLNGSKTVDPSHNAAYVWTFEDNGLKILNGTTHDYSFDYPGDHLVTLSVTTPSGETSNDTVKIHVNDTTPPVAKITRINEAEDDPICIGSIVSFSSSSSYDPENGTIAEFKWNIDGQTEISTRIDHLFSTQGIFVLTLSVKDTRSNLTNTVTRDLKVVAQSSNPDTTNGPIGPGTTQRSDQNINNEFTLPPTITGLIIFVTVLAISGSAFWLLGLTTSKVNKKSLSTESS